MILHTCKAQPILIPSVVALGIQSLGLHAHSDLQQVRQAVPTFQLVHRPARVITTCGYCRGHVTEFAHVTDVTAS